MAKPSGRRRYSPESQQEKKSLGQIQDSFSGWLVNRLADEVGEDLRVQIFDDGQSTGLSFDCQVKSTTELDKLLSRAEKEMISYRLDVKDLAHWEDSVPVTVVLVWDVVRREGRWHDVPSIIRWLDANNPKWRSKARVTVRIPVRRTTDELGRRALRQRIAALALPFFGGRPVEMQAEFEFSKKTDEGRAGYQALRNALDHGDAVTIDGKHITALRHSEWWERLFGTEMRVQSLTISSSNTEVELPLKLMAVGATATESILVRLRQVKAGHKTITLSNEHEDGCVLLRLMMDQPSEAPTITIRTHVEFKHPVKGIPENLAIVRFFKALLDGARMVVGDPDGRPLIGEEGIGKIANLPSRDALDVSERLLNKLAYVQLHVARFGAFDLTEGVGPEEDALIDRLHSLYTKGWWETTNGTLTTEFNKVPKKLDAASLRASPDAVVSIEYTDYKVRLLGVTIPLGRVQGRLLDGMAWVDAVNAAADEKRKDVQLEDVPMRFSVIEPPGPASARKGKKQ